MENIRKQFYKELLNLEIGEDEVLSVKLVGKRFRKKALRVHSDKTRLGDDEEFKLLLNDYNKVIDAIEKHCKDEEEKSKEESEMHLFFKKHNFAKEFSQSWTIFIEKDKVEKWKTQMEKEYPNPKHLQGQGTQYKASIDERNVFTTLYDVLSPKMNIQGHHGTIRKFVLDVLPNIYKKVCEDAQNGKALRSELLPLNARVKLSAETTYSCDVCGKKYVRKPALKKHIQIKHTKDHLTSQQAIIPLSLPLPMPSSIVSEDFSPQNQSSMSSSKDDHNLLEDDKSENTELVNLEETTEIREETGPHHIESNWQCG